MAIVISSVALVAVGGMLVGMGGMLTQTTKDLGVALNESTPETVIARTVATTEEEAAAVVEKAYAGAAEAFESGLYETNSSLLAYAPTQSEAEYAQPLGESTTVWAGRSQTLASVVAMEVVGIGALAFVVGFIASRIVKRSIS